MGAISPRWFDLLLDESPADRVSAFSVRDSRLSPIPSYTGDAACGNRDLVGLDGWRLAARSSNGKVEADGCNTGCTSDATDTGEEASDDCGFGCGLSTLACPTCELTGKLPEDGLGFGVGVPNLDFDMGRKASSTACVGWAELALFLALC